MIDLFRKGLLFQHLFYSLQGGDEEPPGLYCRTGVSHHMESDRHSRCSLSAHSFMFSQPRSWNHSSPTCRPSHPLAPAQAPILTSGLPRNSKDLVQPVETHCRWALNQLEPQTELQGPCCLASHTPGNSFALKIRLSCHLYQEAFKEPVWM